MTLPTPRLDAERVSYVVHELRTPLAVVTGYTSFLLDDGAGTLEPEQREILDRVQRSLTTLERLVADVAEWVRMLVAPGTEAAESIDLGELLDEAADLTAALTGGATAEVDEMRGAAGVQVVGDPIATRQCVLAVAAWVARGSKHGRIRGGFAAGEEDVVVVWRSDGLDAPDDLTETLADPLAPLPGLGDAAAWRLGLAAAARRLARMGGRLAIAHADGDLVVSLTLRRADGTRAEEAPADGTRAAEPA